ncbi:MAG TPA: phosphate ABC transporter permease PstA [Candidatus Limnocylindrales bacterium]|jgi:phosphate transport system permease protein|nr:phosphate ABC transporter permease PstA [Candidatus Limnocylindrales bacterium]
MNRTLNADRIATGVLWAIAVFVVAILLAIILNFVLKSLGTLNLSFLFGDPSDSAVGGIGPLFFNSIYLLVVTLLITVPLGTLGGIYMAEYAHEGRVTNAIRFSQELISSVPSIVVGLFGLALFVRATGGYTALAGALALAVFNLPLMSRLAEQAIRAVPDDERAASLALGATKWQTITRVVLPIAIPGIVTGIILTAGRIFGEAAALIFTAGSSTPTHFDYGYFSLTDPRSPWSPFHTATTMSVYIWHINSESILPDSIRIAVANTASAVLIITVLVFNLGARGLGRALQKRVTGA